MENFMYFHETDFEIELTKREKEVLSHAALTNREISMILGISKSAVELALNKVNRKLNTTDKEQAFIKAGILNLL